MKKSIRISLFFLILAAAWGCERVSNISTIPYIEYKSFEAFDTTDILGNVARGGKLTFSFEDGDGDIGLDSPTENDTIDPNNLVITLYRKIGGVLTPAPMDDPLLPSAYRIPYMEREGQNKLLKGTIDVTFLYLFYNDDDTISYDFYIVDRALNQSNVASTNEIIISEDNVY